MLFFACVNGKYKELAPIYEYCVKRVYPNEDVEVREVPNAQLQRFLLNPGDEYIHITDIDILVLPHEKTHFEYYSQYETQGACYLRGAVVGSGRKWEGEDARICGGHVGFFPEYYEKTEKIRTSLIGSSQGGREFDEVILCRMMRDSGYKIPEKPYTFPNGEPWDKEYRDLHLGDFLSHKWKKWSPDKEKIRQLFGEAEFQRLREELGQYWKFVFSLVDEYLTDQPE